MIDKIFSFFKDNTKRKAIASILAVCVVGATTFGVVLANRNTESNESGKEIVASSMGADNKADLAEEKQTNLEKNEETSVAAETSSEAPKVEKQGDKYIVNGKEYATESEATAAAKTENVQPSKSGVSFAQSEASKAVSQSECEHQHREPLYKNELVREAWDEPEYEWKDYAICSHCGFKSYTKAEFYNHQDTTGHGGYKTGADHLPTGRMIHHEAEYENRVVGWKCLDCGFSVGG